jgi:hypothetical protein
MNQSNAMVSEIDKSDSEGGALAGRRFTHAWLILTGPGGRQLPLKVY